MAKASRGKTGQYMRQGHTESTNYGMGTTPKSTAKADEKSKDLRP